MTDSATVDRATGRWWVDLPSWVAERWMLLGNALTDGVHLVAWPKLASWVTPASMAVGLALPLLHDGPAFTSSHLVMAILVTAGVTSVQVGAAMWLGYGVGMLLWGDLAVRGFRSFLETWLGLPGAFLTVLLLVWFFTAGLGMATLAVRLDLRSRGIEQRLGRFGSALITVGTTVGLSYFLVKAMPVMVRPIYAWQGTNPDRDAVVPVQERWWIVVLVAAVAAVIRVLVERQADPEAVVPVIAQLNGRLVTIQESARELPRWLMIGAQASGLTFLVAALVDQYWLIPFVLAYFTLIVLIRERLLESETWGRLAVLPVLGRYMIGAAGAWAITRVVLGTQTRRIGSIDVGFRTDSFLPALIAVCLSLALFMLITAPRVHDERMPS